MCGIAGVVGRGPVNQLLYDALTLLQHRGQDAAGIVTSDGNKFHLRKNNGLDFDDLLMETARLLRKNPLVRQKYQDRYRYVLVDEFQDTNVAQYELIKLLTGKDGNVFVVADEDQSIYRFRGAEVRNILDSVDRDSVLRSAREQITSVIRDS